MALAVGHWGQHEAVLHTKATGEVDGGSAVSDFHLSLSVWSACIRMGGLWQAIAYPVDELMPA